MRGLTRAEWEALCGLVFERDLRQAWLWANTPIRFEVWRQGNEWRACVASFLVTDAGPCRGRITFDHVKDRPKIGDPIVKRHTQDRKAPDNEQHLQSVCEGHHGLDVTNGYGWAATEAGREISREYLAALYPAPASG